MLKQLGAFFYNKNFRKWIVEYANGNAGKTSAHSSRIKALIVFFLRHPGKKKFYICEDADGDTEENTS